jgi:hypothetical protein
MSTRQFVRHAGVVISMQSVSAELLPTHASGTEEAEHSESKQGLLKSSITLGSGPG